MQPKKIITTPHTTLKEEKLSAFLDTGQRNKGEERGEENLVKEEEQGEEKRNLTLIMGSLLTKRDIRKKIFS